MNNILSINNLKKTYKDGTMALKGVSLEVPKGTIYGLLGPNGAGKSTLISIVTTALGKTMGDVYINGYSLEDETEKIRASIGVIFQESVRETGLTGNEILVNHGKLYGMKKEAIKKKAATLLKQIGLEEVANKNIETYSGGMRRKLEIIKGILTSPEILFLDEPTLGLDPQSRKQIWLFLNKMKNEGTTIFVTSHYIEEIERNADHIAIIDSGELRCEGIPSKIIANFNALNDTGKRNLEDIFLYYTEERKEEII